MGGKRDRKSKGAPAPPGGRAAERLRQFEEQRGYPVTPEEDREPGFEKERQDKEKKKKKEKSE